MGLRGSLSDNERQTALGRSADNRLVRRHLVRRTGRKAFPKHFLFHLVARRFPLLGTDAAIAIGIEALHFTAIELKLAQPFNDPFANRLLMNPDRTSPAHDVAITIGGLSNVSISGSQFSTTNLSITTSDLIVTGTSTQFTTALSNLSSALTSVLEAEETVGAWVSRLEFELDDKSQTEIADRASLSTIVDADLAEEQVRLSSLQILQQTSLIGLISANQAPASVLSLVSG